MKRSDQWLTIPWMRLSVPLVLVEGEQIRQINPAARRWLQHVFKEKDKSWHDLSTLLRDLPEEIQFHRISLQRDLFLVQLSLGDPAQVYERFKEMEDQNRELEAIFASSYDELYVTDGKGITLRVNNACERLYGLKAEELIGRSVFELEKEGVFSPSVSALVYQLRRRITLSQKTRRGRQIIVTGNPVFDRHGNLIRIVHNSRDITELKELQEELDRTKEQVVQVQQEMKMLQLQQGYRFLLGNSAKMGEVIELARRVAPTETTILLLGESGVGKNLLARYIHDASRRSLGPFVEINCGTIPENLIESELFGYAAGAFTGANKQGQKGKVELADKGTLFLNEIGELPLHVQAKFLDLLQQKTIAKVGEPRVRQVDVRILAATNQNLAEMVKQKKFREDLYYRLNVVPLQIPPLRERREDIPLLATYFLSHCAKRNHVPEKEITPAALERFIHYSWPGNVRELENLIERLTVTLPGEQIDVADLPDYVRYDPGGTGEKEEDSSRPLKDILLEAEKRALLQAARHCRTTYELARWLSISQPTAVRKLKQHQIEL